MSRHVNSRFLVRPLDTVFFGRPRSFNAGESHRAVTEFPPTGYAFQGMVRSQLLRAVQPALDLDDSTREAAEVRTGLVGGPDALPEGWQLNGPFPARTVDQDDDMQLEPWVPTPRFLLGRGERVCRARLIVSTQAAMNDLGDTPDLLGCPELGDASALDGWIGPANLHCALTGEGRWSEASHGASLPPFVTGETRPGLALERGTARHGMLYFLRTLRFSQTRKGESGLFGWLSGDWDRRIPDNALNATLGAAGRKERPAAFIAAPATDPVFQSLLDGKHLPATVEEDALFWLVTLTPVALAHPDRPLAQVAPGIRFKARALLTGPPLTIGGYRYADARTRANRTFLPAGSCWLFNLGGGGGHARAAALRRLNDAHLLGAPEEAGFGFGHTLVGLGPREQEDIS